MKRLADLLELTQPIQELEGEQGAVWLVMERKVRPGEDVQQVTVTLVRAGSPADPRERYRDLLGGGQ